MNDRWLAGRLVLALVLGAGGCGGNSSGGESPDAASGSGGSSTGSGSGGGSGGQGSGGSGGTTTSSGSGGTVGGSGSGGTAGPGSGGSIGTTGNGGSIGGGKDVAGPPITITEFAIPTSSQPGGLCAGPDGKIWFLHQSTAPSAVGNLTTAGTNFALINIGVTNTGPISITGGPDGNVWYTKQGGLGKVTPGGQDSEFGAGGGDSGVIIAGPDGNLWFTEPLHDKIARAAPANAAVTQYNLPTAGCHPFGITVGPDGNLWFTESAAVGNKIGKITPAGMVTEYPVPTAAANPLNIVKSTDGNLWFTEFDGHKVGKITPAGMVTEYPLGSDGKPNGIAADGDGNMWFTEGGGPNLIGRITPMGAISEYTIPSANADGAGIALGPDKNIWFAELSTNKIARISNLAGGGTINSITGGDGAMVTLGRMCAKDSDCVDSGKACGGDVCSSATTPHSCVLASSGDPGTCATDADCWCMSMGATCAAATHHCSMTQF
ncbi:MAG TPA: hypothetical protein VH374_20940 [Polyangia bacterium]|jgi:streptogramin lyase|nr:hypothetical protein [Polyangia bacterium]